MSIDQTCGHLFIPSDCKLMFDRKLFGKNVTSAKILYSDKLVSYNNL